MTKYITNDSTIEADGPADLVDKMSQTSFSQSESAQAWMEDAAARHHMISGIDVRTDSADNFVADLIAAGLVKEAPPP